MASFAAQPLSRTAPGRWLLDNAGLLVLPAICLLPVLLTAPFFTEPFERDEGAYATIAQGLLRGDLPYRDFFDHKPPLIYVWYALSFLLFGEGIVAPRLMAALVWALTTLVVYKEAALLEARRVARGAALIFAASSGLVLLQANANTEVFMLLPLTFSLFALTKALQNGNGLWLLAAGASVALAALTKQVAVINLVAAAFVLAGYGLRQGRPGHAFRQITLLVGGAALVVGIALLPFLLSHAVDDFIYANWTYNRLYGSETSLAQRVDSQMVGDRFFLFVASPLVLAGIVGIVGLFSTLRREVKANLLPAAWLVVTYAGLLLSGRAFPHYYVGLLPPLALLAGSGIASFRLSDRARKLFLPALALGAVLCFVLNANVFLQPTPEQRHLARFGQDSGAGIAPGLASNSYTATDLARHNASARLAAYVRSVTGPSDTIYNYGRETQLYFYTDRRPASRYIYDRSFELDPSTFDVAMSELREDPPAIIIDSRSAISSIERQKAQPLALRDFLESNFEYVGQIEYADVYQLKPTPQR